MQRFLLSNVRYWLEEFRFDGFRFDGVTSMLYLDHGLGKAFSSYDDYFGDNVDHDAVAYLQLANELAHDDQARRDHDRRGRQRHGRHGPAGRRRRPRLRLSPGDGRAGLLDQAAQGEAGRGVGPRRDLSRTLLNRRHGEKHVGYAESHDQALVGDKTLAFWLMDKDMYWHMDTDSQSLVIDRGIALHKLIRLITFSLAGEGVSQLHGQRVRPPRVGRFPARRQQLSYHYARRQWSLADNAQLRYSGLQRVRPGDAVSSTSTTTC